MTRPFLLVLLGVGTLAGFAAGFRSVRHGEFGWDHRYGRPHPHSIDDWANACLRAAERASQPAPSAPAP
jgi:hypothetical protein